MKSNHRIMGKVKLFCIDKGIEFREVENGLDLKLVRIWKPEKSGYRGMNKGTGIELRLNTQKEIINYIRYYYKI